MKKITLIKLGGSVITDKAIPEHIREKIVKNLALQIANYKPQKDELLIIGNGAGSFGHYPAKKYHTMEGFINNDSLKGMALTQDAVARLNRIIVKQLIDHNLPAISFSLSQNSIANEGKPEKINLSVLNLYLKNDLLPVTYGDVIVDTSKGCTIWSTEKVFAVIIENLKSDFGISRVIHVSDVDGFLDEKGKVVAKIDATSFNQLQNRIKETNGVDVTGGIYHKLEESINLTKSGVKSYIISGIINNNLLNCLNDKKFIGTEIS